MMSVARQSGVGMLEVLVALFVFGIGLLGATALSVQAYRLENRAQVRARIGLLAADLAGRVRSNTAALSEYGGQPAEHGCSSGLTPARVCTPKELAADDLWHFNNALRALAPTAAAALHFDDQAVPATGKLSIEWSDGQHGQHLQMAFAL